MQCNANIRFALKCLDYGRESLNFGQKDLSNLLHANIMQVNERHILAGDF